MGYKPNIPREFHSVEGVLSRMIAECGGTDVVADDLGLSISRLNACANPVEEKKQISYSVMRRMAKTFGATAAAHDMANVSGGYFTKLGPSTYSLAVLLAKSEEEHGEFAPRMIAAIAKDGARKLSERDRADIRRDIQEMVRAYLAADMKLAEPTDGR